MADNLFCGSFSVDDGFIGLGLIGPAKVIACHGELIVLPCRVDLGSGRRSVGERDVDAGNGGVGVGYLRKRYDAYDIDNDDKTQDDKERRLFARLIVLGGFARGAAIASSVRWWLLGRIAVCLALLTLLSLLVRALGSVCRTTLLTVARRDRTRRLNAAGVPARLLRIGNQLSSIVLRHRMHILRFSPCGSSCFYWACIIEIALLFVVRKRWHSKEVGHLSHL